MTPRGILDWSAVVFGQVGNSRRRSRRSSFVAGVGKGATGREIAALPRWTTPRSGGRNRSRLPLALTPSGIEGRVPKGFLTPEPPSSLSSRVASSTIRIVRSNMTNKPLVTRRDFVQGRLPPGPRWACPKCSPNRRGRRMDKRSRRASGRRRWPSTAPFGTATTTWTPGTATAGRSGSWSRRLRRDSPATISRCVPPGAASTSPIRNGPPREIDLAADHNIDVFLFDWYWYSGVPIMQEGLEQRLLEGPQPPANEVRPDVGQPQLGRRLPRRPTASPGTPGCRAPLAGRPCRASIDYCVEHYFRQPNYWTVDGRLFFSVFQPGKLIKNSAAQARSARCWPTSTASLTAPSCRPCTGTPSTTTSPTTRASRWPPRPKWSPSFKRRGFTPRHVTTLPAVSRFRRILPRPSRTRFPAHVKAWKRLAQTPLPSCPVVTMGWDVTARCEHNIPWPFAKTEYPYLHVVLGNTPERYSQLCKLAAEFTSADGKRPFAVFLNAWNEWTEGSYLLPEQKYGLAYSMRSSRRSPGDRRAGRRLTGSPAQNAIEFWNSCRISTGVPRGARHPPLPCCRHPA